MKTALHRTLAALSVFFFIVVFAPGSAHAQLGIAAGANFDSYSDIDTGSGEQTIDNATGFHVGVFYDLSFGPFGVRPGAYYMDVGTIDFGSEEEARESVDLTLLEFPLDLRYRFVTPILTPYATAGPVFRIANADDFEGETNDVNVAANVGVGVEVGLPAVGFRLYPELRYSFAINDTVEDFGFEGEDDTTRLNNFMLRLGVRF